MGKRTTITIETRSFVVLRSEGTTRAWCSVCNTECEVIAIEPVGRAELPDLQQWLSSAGVHKAYSADGKPLLCLQSILACVQNQTTANRLLAGDQAQKETP